MSVDIPDEARGQAAFAVRRVADLSVYQALDVAEAVLTAAYPIIERQIRDQVADEIEAKRTETVRGRPGFAVGNETFNEGIEHAVRIARGGQDG